MAKTPHGQTSDSKRPQVATREELNNFLDRLASLKENLRDEEATTQREAIRSYLQTIGREKLRQLMKRAFGDALKSPSQKLGTAKLPSGNGPSTKRKSLKREKTPSRKAPRRTTGRKKKR